MLGNKVKDLVQRGKYRKWVRVMGGVTRTSQTTRDNPQTTGRAHGEMRLCHLTYGEVSSLTELITDNMLDSLDGYPNPSF